MTLMKSTVLSRGLLQYRRFLLLSVLLQQLSRSGRSWQTLKLLLPVTENTLEKISHTHRRSLIKVRCKRENNVPKKIINKREHQEIGVTVNNPSGSAPLPKHSFPPVSFLVLLLCFISSIDYGRDCYSWNWKDKRVRKWKWYNL